MIPNTDAQIRHVHDRWHESIVGRELDRLMALYADDAILETPLTLVTMPDRTRGILRGEGEIALFFEAGLLKLESKINLWYRTGLLFSDERQIMRQYPRETPQGDQIDLVEVMDLSDGLIAHNRVYWGWIGFQNLVAALQKPASYMAEARS